MKQIFLKLSATLLGASLLFSLAGAQWHHHHRYEHYYHRRHVVVVYHHYYRPHPAVIVYEGHRGYWHRHNGINVFIRL